MSKKSCKKCYYYGRCDGQWKCEYYMPVDDREEDRIIAEQTEEERISFYNEWFLYTQE